MSREVFDEISSKVFKSLEFDQTIHFNWHSGEPLIAGIPFYEYVFEQTHTHKQPNQKVIHSLQTNGVLINQKWCDFFNQKSFELGISIDGPEFIHNINRKSWKGRGSFELVSRGISYLRKNNIVLRGLAVLTKDSLDYPREIFHYFLNEGFHTLAFNIEEQVSANINHYLKRGTDGYEEIYDKFLNFWSTLFDLWWIHQDKIKVREFDVISKMIYRKKMDDNYSAYNIEVDELAILTINSKGGISTHSPEMASGTSDDQDRFIVTNIYDIQNLSEIKLSSKYQDINRDIQIGVANCKKECQYFDFCGGGSPACKYYENKSFKGTETGWCALDKQQLISLVINKYRDLTMQKN